MRSWLADFVRRPNSLPPDPGAGYERISLTLPEELVRDASKYLHCSHSEALRRIAVQQLGLFSVPLPTSTTATGSHTDRFTSRTADATLSGERRSVPVSRASSVIALMIVFLPLIVFLAWIFFTQRKSMTRKRT